MHRCSPGRHLACIVEGAWPSCVELGSLPATGYDGSSSVLSSGAGCECTSTPRRVPWGDMIHTPNGASTKPPDRSRCGSRATSGPSQRCGTLRCVCSGNACALLCLHVQQQVQVKNRHATRSMERVTFFGRHAPYRHGPAERVFGTRVCCLVAREKRSKRDWKCYLWCSVQHARRLSFQGTE